MIIIDALDPVSRKWNRWKLQPNHHTYHGTTWFVSLTSHVIVKLSYISRHYICQLNLTCHCQKDAFKLYTCNLGVHKFKCHWKQDVLKETTLSMIVLFWAWHLLQMKPTLSSLVFYMLYCRKRLSEQQEGW